MPFTHFKFSSTWCGQRMKRDSNQGLWTFCILIHLTLKRPLAPKLKQSHGRNSNWWLPHCLPSTRSTIQFIQSFDYVSLRQYSVTFDCNVLTRSLDHEKIQSHPILQVTVDGCLQHKRSQTKHFLQRRILGNRTQWSGKTKALQIPLFLILPKFSCWQASRLLGQCRQLGCAR